MDAYSGLRNAGLGAIPGLALAAALLAACGLNEIEMPENPCTAPLRSGENRQAVNYEHPEVGQLSLYRGFNEYGDSLWYTRDTLLATVYSLHPDSFRLTEQVCLEQYLSPNPMRGHGSDLSWKDSILQIYGYSEILPYSYIDSAGLDLRPQGPFLPFQGFLPADTTIPSGYGRIAGFTLGTWVYDTVSVLVKREPNLVYWIFTARDGLLVKASISTWGSNGWVRVD